MLLLTGCMEKEVTTQINVIDNLEFDYGQDIYLYDVMSIVDGSFIDQNQLLDTLELGDRSITVNYKNSNKKKDKYTINYKVVDKVNPILSVPENIYVKVGSEIELLKKSFCGDNADRHLKCEVIGEYDLNTIGNYKLEYRATDSSNNSVSKDTTLHVIKEFSSSGSSNKGTNLSYFIKNYKNDNTSIGIDVSSHQGEIDFNKVKEAGIDFVIIRMGFGPNSEGNITMDKYFLDNYNNAKEAGLKIGYYFFSYGTTMDEVDIITNWIDEQLKDKQVDLPIAYDWESWNTFYSCEMNFRDLNMQAEKFLKNLSNKGYDVMMYGSKSKLNTIWELDRYTTWLAQYYKEPTYEKDFKIWQVSEEGVVDGINTLVDINILYN